MVDYTSNSNKDKDPKDSDKKSDKEKPKVEKIIQGDVVVQKKSLGRKIKDMFVAADFKSVTRYLVEDVMLPAAKNLIVESVNKGVDRVIYGDRAVHMRSQGYRGPHVIYNSPINRGEYRDPRTNPPTTGPRVPRRGGVDYILETRIDAEAVLETLREIIAQYDVVSLADLNDLTGQPQTHVDQTWGWYSLQGASVIQVREGFMIDLPALEKI